MYVEFAERLMDVARQGQSRLAELRATAEGTIELQQQLLLQVEQAATTDEVSGSSDVDAIELTKLRDEVEWLEDKLKLAQDELAEQKSKAASVDESELVTELEQARRDLKRLEEELEEARQAEDVPSYLASYGSSSDDDETTEQLKLAQEEVEQRDNQIAELQTQLQQLQAEVESQPEHDAFASDDEIAAERENLRQLQQEWHEKLRNAELEISIERARMARDRSELEERLATMESELQALQGGDSKETVRGKWFARLGLKEDD